MKTFRFNDFKVYNDSKEFCLLILTTTKKLPKEYSFDLISQIRRSALSIVLNIAEGSAGRSDKEFNHFLEISLGSLSETVACLEMARDLKLINMSEFDRLVLRAEDIARQLGGFSRKLKLDLS